MIIQMFSDGGARGNPGKAAIGVAIYLVRCVSDHVDKNRKCTCRERKLLAQISKTIGETTNNIAEYKAVEAGMLWLEQNKAKFQKAEKIQCFLDSLLVTNQLNGTFKIKNSNLRKIFTNIRIIEQGIDCSVYYVYIPREYNSEADGLVNEALDDSV